MAQSPTMTFAIIRFRQPGIHRWPDMPEGHPHPYLVHPHRHVFHVEVRVVQAHDGRDVEYLQAADTIKDAFISMRADAGDPVPDFGSQSCETLARALHGKCRQMWPNRYLQVSVLEDGENGAEIEG